MKGKLAGSGKKTESFKPGETVSITADEPAEGYRFKKWMVLSGNVEFEAVESASTSFVMPASAVTIKAVYKAIGDETTDNEAIDNEAIGYKVNVVNGSGDGSYQPGDIVTVTADTLEGQTFLNWRFDTQKPKTKLGTTIFSKTMTFEMPDRDITIEALYK